MDSIPLETLLLEGVRSGQIGGSLDDHARHALGFVQFGRAATFGGSIVDLGSGVGLPALILAAAYPDTRWTLIERRTGRAELLRRGVIRLGWSERIEVWADDAAEAVERSRGAADWVTARAFGPPATTAELGAPFLKPGGSLLTSEPRAADTVERWPPDGLARCGLELAETWQTEAGSYVRLVRTEVELTELPRRGARKLPIF